MSVMPLVVAGIRRDLGANQLSAGIMLANQAQRGAGHAEGDQLLKLAIQVDQALGGPGLVELDGDAPGRPDLVPGTVECVGGALERLIDLFIVRAMVTGHGTNTVIRFASHEGLPPSDFWIAARCEASPTVSSARKSWRLVCMTKVASLQ
jgi:hypothetical protein